SHYPAPTAIYPLSLHDALPISVCPPPRRSSRKTRLPRARSRLRRRQRTLQAPSQSLARQWLQLFQSVACDGRGCDAAVSTRVKRSEEHTSELQSHLNLVCRLLL